MPKKKTNGKIYKKNTILKGKNLLLFFVFVLSFFSIFVTVNQLQKPQTITQHADTITTAVTKPIWGCLGLGSSEICTSTNDGNNFSMDPNSASCLIVKGSLTPEQVEQGQTLNFTFEISVKDTPECKKGFPLSPLSVKATHTKSAKTFTVEEKSTSTTLSTNGLTFTPKHTIDAKEALGEWTATLYMPGANNTEVKFPGAPDLKFTVSEPCNKDLEILSGGTHVDKGHYNVGEAAHATITFRNSCTTNFSVSDILIYLIKPSNGDTTTTDTFGTRSGKNPHTFTPRGQQGDTYTVDATMTIPENPCGVGKPTCVWAARGAYVKLSGSVIQESKQTEFTVGALDPVDAARLSQSPSRPPGANPPSSSSSAKLARRIIYFDFDSTAIKPMYNATLDSVAQFLKTNTGTKVTLAGHTDNVGSPVYNIELGRRRAESVRTYLVGKGIASNRFTIDSKGETQPAASNATPAGRSKNRRVEMFTP